MFSFRKPSPKNIKDRLAEAAGLPISYAGPFGTSDGPDKTLVPHGFSLDHTRTQIGHGPEAFSKAKAAIREWKHFDLGWVRVANPRASIESGQLVAVEAHALTLWSINISRILYVIDQADDPNRFGYGYGYGTTDIHVERGEERFLLEFDPATKAVYYDLLAISQPANWLARLGYLYTRRQQHNFATQSHRKMQQICRE